MADTPATTYLVKGAAIRIRRMELGMTQSDCAARAGISRPYLSQLETGKRRDMAPHTYQALRTTLCIEPTDRRLLDQRGDQHRKERHGSPHEAEART